MRHVDAQLLYVSVWKYCFHGLCTLATLDIHDTFLPGRFTQSHRNL